MSKETAAPAAAPVYLQLLEAAARQFADPSWYDPNELAPGLYSTALELAERLLQDVAAGRRESEAHAFRVMQQQVPILREWAGIDLDGPDPAAEYERGIRVQFGIPVPAA